jgi:hypothetical protein
MIWNISAEEKRIARELLVQNIDFGVEFAKLPEESAVRIAPLNRSTRPNPGAKVPPEYHYLIDSWVTQDLLFAYLGELTDAAQLFGWNRKLVFEVRGLRGHELVYELAEHRRLLKLIIALPWYRELWRKIKAWKKLNFSEPPQGTV